MTAAPAPPATRVPLTRCSVLAVDGADADAFIQGQLSLDIARVTADQSRAGALSSQKGRVLALVRALRIDERLLLLLPGELASATRDHLARFVLRSAVTLSVVDDEYRVVGISAGGDAATAGRLPEPVDAVTRLKNGCLIRILDSGEPRAVAVVRGGAPAEFDSLAAGSADAWELAQIRAGLPSVVEATRERFVAQMLNLDLTGAISFTKGCYVGQEIIARTQNLGRIKRRMLGFRAPRGAAPLPGTALLTADEGSGAPAGQVIRAAAEPGGGFSLLAVISLSERGKAFVTAGDEHRLEPFPLPYAVPELRR